MRTLDKKKMLLTLGFLVNGKRHGYEITRMLSGPVHKQLLRFTPSTIYYLLKKAQQEGFVRSDTEKEGNRPERNVFSLTEKGRLYWKKLAEEVCQESDQRWDGADIVMLFSDQFSPEKISELLSARLADLRGQRAQIDEAIGVFKNGPAHGSPPDAASGGGAKIAHVSLLERIREHLDTDIDWFEKTLKS